MVAASLTSNLPALDVELDDDAVLDQHRVTVAAITDCP